MKGSGRTKSGSSGNPRGNDNLRTYYTYNYGDGKIETIRLSSDEYRSLKKEDNAIFSSRREAVSYSRGSEPVVNDTANSRRGSLINFALATTSKGDAIEQMRQSLSLNRSNVVRERIGNNEQIVLTRTAFEIKNTSTGRTVMKGSLNSEEDVTKAREYIRKKIVK